MIISTFFMGATFPIAAQLYSNRLQVLGRRVGGIYSVNTLGAIFGSLIAGFALIPLIGTERTILVGLFLNAGIALLLLSEQRGRAAIARWGAVAVLLVSTVSMMGGVFWSPEVLDRGVLVYSSQFDTRPYLTMSEHYADTDVVYFDEGNNASISVRRGNNYYGLRTNGKVDASNGRDMTTQLMIGLLPGFYHPSPGTYAGGRLRQWSDDRSGHGLSGDPDRRLCRNRTRRTGRRPVFRKVQSEELRPPQGQHYYRRRAKLPQRQRQHL